MRAYGPHVGRRPTPPASALTRPRLERWSFALQGIAIVPLLVGTWTLNESWLRAGTGLLAAGVGLFVADMIGVLWHLRPATAASSAATPSIVPAP
jgi:hypothetical protein